MIEKSQNFPKKVFKAIFKVFKNATDFQGQVDHFYSLSLKW